MLENVIESPERLVWAVDGGESGYVILARGDDAEYGRAGIDFTIISDMGYVLGSSLPDVERNQKAGGALQVPFMNEPRMSLMLDALESFLSFLGAAAEKYAAYDMPGEEDPEGSDLFNLQVRAWADQNEDAISMAAADLEG